MNELNTLNVYNTSDKSIQGLNQDIYDYFNGFIFSKDKNVFNKLCMRMKIYEMTQHLMGDIVECGVFKGSGLLTWLKLLNLHEPHSLKKVIGFDYFDPTFVDNLKDPKEKQAMGEVFQRVSNLNTNELSLAGVTERILNAGMSPTKFELIDGDIGITAPAFKNLRPGARISVLYLDMDLYEPTVHALKNLWDLVVPGGVVVFDEYAYHAWTESRAADEFCAKYKQTLISTRVSAPTAFIIKHETSNSTNW